MKNSMMILLILIVILLAIRKRSNESFSVSNSGIGSIPTLYNKHIESPYQIGQIHHPGYNYPSDSRQYPYYNYFFNPYNSAVYY
jgi:hypothetical protein